MKNSRFLFTLALLIFQLTSWAQQEKLIELVPEGLSSLTAEQYSKYETITKQHPYGIYYLSTIGDLPSLQRDGVLTFELPEKECAITAISNRVNYVDRDNYSWSGVVIPMEGENYRCGEGSLTILRKNGKYIGHFSVSEDTYVLEDLGEGKQLIVKLAAVDDNHSFCGIEVDADAEESGDSSTKSGGDRNCPVTILALYTANAQNEVSDIELTIDFEIEKTNTAFQRSQVDFEIELIGVQEIDFTEFLIRSDIDLLPLDEDITALRDDFNADVVVLLTGDYFNPPGSGAVRGVVAEVGPDEENAYAIVEASSCSKGFTFSHEVAHLFGCRHELENDDTGSFEHAYKFPSFFFSSKRTIMWSRSKSSRIQNFSNPNVNYGGHATGVWNKIDNARKLNSTGCEVAAFRDDENDILTGNVLVPFTMCYGENLHAEAVVWGGAIGTYEYAWSYSYDGFDFTDTGGDVHETLFSNVTPPETIPTTLSSYIYIRVQVTDDDGNTVTLSKSVEVIYESEEENAPCRHHPEELRMPNGGGTYKNAFLVSPNPVSDKLSLSVLGNKEIEQVQVVSLEGKILVSDFYSGEIDVSKLPAGVYIVTAKSSGEVLTSKFIKL